MFIIRIDQGDYLQQRGGFDWGRASRGDCDLYETQEEAEAIIRKLGVNLIVQEIEQY